MNVLIVDDGTTAGEFVGRILHTYGYIPHFHKSCDNIKMIVESFPLPVAIVNSTLTSMEGTAVCTLIRETRPDTIIIGVNSAGPWQHKVEMIEHGADDCLSFPFPANELLARLHAIQRRPPLSHQNIITFGRISIDPHSKKVLYGSSPMDLTKKEFLVLEYMVRNKDRTISRTELQDHVWDYNRIINSNTIDVHIQKIRRKLQNAAHTIKMPEVGKSIEEKDGENYVQGSISTPEPGTEDGATEETVIRTVHGIGYRLDGNLPPAAD